MLDTIADGFLLFSDGIIIAPLIFIGFIFFDRSLFYHALCVLLFCILLNVALKVSFQIPLSPALNKKGFAFPSGHMQLVTVFYTWLAFKLNKNWLSLATVILLAGVGASLIHFGYHTIDDVVAGFTVGLLLLVLYYQAYLKWPKNMPWFLVIIASFLLFYIDLRWQIAGYVWMAYVSLVVIITLEKVVAAKRISKKKNPRG